MPRNNPRGFARQVDVKQRNVHQIYAIIDGTGTAAINLGSTEVALVDNGTGDYNVNPIIAGSRLLNVQVTTLTADSIVQLGTVSASAIQVLAFDATDGTTAKDIDFHITITLSDDPDEI